MEKHKRPAGFGTWCPPMPEGRAQQLLANAIPDPEEATGSAKLYAVDGEWCFVAQPTQLDEEIYHGYPVPGSEVPERVLRQFKKAGRITVGQLNRLRRQVALPPRYE